MNLFDKIQRSWRLLKSSVLVIRNHPKLLWFPALIGVFTILIALFFLAPILFLPTGYHLTQAAHWQALGHKLFLQETGGTKYAATFVLRPWLCGYGALIYLVSMFAATFCNVALNSQVIGALNGEPVSFRRGLAVAASRLKSILAWTLFAGLAGLIIRQIEQRLGIIGRIIAGLIGLAWSVACVFVIPVLVREEPTANPFHILAKSAGTIKRTWGEMLVGYVGLQGTNSLALLASLVWLGAAVAVAFALSNFWILLPVGAVWLLGLVAYGYLSSVASQVYLCALYIYATEGVVPEPYDRQLLDAAWKVKKP